MKRRDSLKALTLGTLGVTTLLQSCDTDTKKTETSVAETILNYDRHPFEKMRDEKLLAEKFFDEHEMKTITVLGDIIIPKDDVSGNASEAGVPAFIEFIVKDRPYYQLPVRGGLKWLDMQCFKQFNNSFVDCSAQQHIAMVDQIAYPEKAKPEMQQGVAFFNIMRDLTTTGFFTSAIGIKDLGYMGNKPNQWDGVPKEVLDQMGLAYDEKTLRESVKFDS
ncbi:MAG: gluconate 2-dehydrogenase subunit 3 family protein [Cyclobacteriaceae bacterium]|nr:gluconate 2-dehydrogenase subunit 3 family protein [Cyclobacteriaceae bacterium]